MGNSIELCSPQDFPSLLAALDQEFVLAKGRTISLAQRFPRLVHPSAPLDVYSLIEDGKLCAAATVKQCSYKTPERSWVFAMIGLVYTFPEFRGKGLASGLLRQLEENFQKEGFDFGVLFTGIPKFYERIGWVGSDRGLFAHIEEPRFVAAEGSLSTARKLTAGDSPWIEAIRSRYLAQRMERLSADYSSIPLPALSVKVYQQSKAYLILGEERSSAYFYEIAGDCRQFPLLWNSVCRDFKDVFVNDCKDNISSQWLAENLKVTWKPQMQTMWRALNPQAQKADTASWFIPYFDRI